MNGEYKEKLPSGKGELIVSGSSWKIEYYFSGPDYRYNGTWVKIPENSIDKYISAFRNNWNKYKSLKESALSLEGEIKVNGEMNMTINVGGYYDGVCIQSYHMPLKTEPQIQAVIDDYNWAKKRSESVIMLFAQLNSSRS